MNYHSQLKFQYIKIKKRTFGFKKNTKKHDLIFNYNIREDPMLGIIYVDIICIPCIYYVCLRKMVYPWNRRQYKSNKVLYKGENQQCVIWPILGSYNNWWIINCLGSRKQHEETITEINVHIEQNAISNISLNIGKISKCQ